MSLRRLGLPSLVVCLFATPVFAQECVDVKGALLAKKDGGWQALQNGAKVPLDRLLVSLFWSDLRSANGAVDLRLRGDIGEFGPLPSLETAIKVHDNPKVDLDVSLERGIIVLTNAKKAGPATVDVRIRGKALNVTLKEPGAKLGIDLYARHAPGLHSVKTDDPTYFIFMLNGVGAADVSYGDKTIALHAPPGPALVKWDSHFHDAAVEHLDKLPEWIVPTPEEAKVIAKINQAAKALADDDAGKVFLKLLFSDDPIDRKVGFTALGALGSPAALGVALQKSKHPEARQFAVGIIRGWLGQEPGQIKKLQAALADLGVSKIGSETLIHLLLGFDDAERQDPVTYQLLIEGLGHSKPLVRELSYWHLVRMAPAGKSIPYDPAGPPDQIEAGVRQWRELIPAGQLPSAPKK